MARGDAIHIGALTLMGLGAVFVLATGGKEVDPEAMGAWEWALLVFYTGSVIVVVPTSIALAIARAWRSGDMFWVVMCIVGSPIAGFYPLLVNRGDDEG